MPTFLPTYPEEGKITVHGGSLAGRAQADQLEQVLVDAVAGGAADLFEEGRQVAALELDGGATLAADEVVMVAVTGADVAVTTIVGVNAPDEAQIGQQLQGAIDGDQADGGAAGLSPLTDLGRAVVALVFEQGADHGPAGPGDAVAGLAELVKDDLFVEHS
jgi:hypothetical protein